VVLGAFADLCVADVPAAADYFRRLLDLDLHVDHGWYVELAADDHVVLALVEAGHPTVPPSAGSPPRGLLVSFEVDDASHVATRAAEMECEFVLGLADELGQRHFMVKGPDGVIVDVIQRVPLTADDLRRLAGYRRQHRSAVVRA
jgi:hypothetical protein